MQPSKDKYYKYSNTMHDFTYIVVPDNHLSQIMNFVVIS